MKALQIIQCSDSLMWYRDLVGAIVPYRYTSLDTHMSAEPAGYANIVKIVDAMIIDVPDGYQFYTKQTPESSVLSERVRELMVEAGYAAPELAVRAQKLASLLIDDCIRVIQYGITRDGNRTPQYLRSKQHINDLTEHFGVK